MIDACVLAHLAAVINPEPRPLSDEASRGPGSDSGPQAPGNGDADRREEPLASCPVCGQR